MMILKAWKLSKEGLNVVQNSVEMYVVHNSTYSTIIY